MTPRPPGPVQRVRLAVAERCGNDVAAQLPRGFQRLGHVALVRLPEGLRARYPEIGAAYARELGVRTVLRPRGAVTGEYRIPAVETIAGGDPITEVLEHGVRYRFDASQIMFAAGNHRERRRAGDLVRPGERVVDLFAGIGYLTIPAARPGRAAHVDACEANPVSTQYLRENLRLNGVADTVTVWPGDNREAEIPSARADRVFLGLLPESVSFVPRALGLLRPEGGTMHVHRLRGTRDPLESVIDAVRLGVEAAGRSIRSASVHVVKPYGPGREHVVVDCRISASDATRRGDRSSPEVGAPTGHSRASSA